MPYITAAQTLRAHQITLEELLMGEVDIRPMHVSNRAITGTVTRFVASVSPQLKQRYPVHHLCEKLSTFIETHSDLFEAERRSLYRSFHIPKRSGGLRKIDQPNDELMSALRELVSLLQNDFCAMYHTAAFAYIRGRSTLDAVKKHQQYRSRWFLKIDFENFFGSTTLDFVMSMLEQIFPFSEVMANDHGRDLLTKAISLCFLDDGLPQGTPISPMLTNLMMIPIDHKISNSLIDDGFVYTRYADDSIISHRDSFRFVEMCARIEEILAEFNAPFRIKRSKTRYGSNAGSNWNLGVMLNKDNQITIGYKNKKTFKIMVNNFLADRANGIIWSPEDIMHLQGLTSYYTMVEKANIAEIIRRYNEKFGTDFIAAMKADLS